MSSYLILFKTWLEAEIETPWDFALADYSNEWKNRSTGQKVPADVVDACFHSLNEVQLETFLSQHVDAVCLATIIDADTSEAAILNIKQYFPDCEPIEIQAIPNDLVAVAREELSRK